jgi:hypothetical protein
MSLTLTLADAQATKTWDLLEVPFTESEVKGQTQVEVQSGNAYVDYVYRKFVWSHTWKYMSETEYLELVGFRERQYQTFQCPLVTIPELGVHDVPVIVSVGDRNIISNCGTVRDVKLTLRETAQNANS